jgi:formylglycine-generating enzyme required for sulfatase activity
MSDFLRTKLDRLEKQHQSRLQQYKKTSEALILESNPVTQANLENILESLEPEIQQLEQDIAQIKQQLAGNMAKPITRLPSSAPITNPSATPENTISWWQNPVIVVAIIGGIFGLITAFITIIPPLLEQSADQSATQNALNTVTVNGTTVAQAITPSANSTNKPDLTATPTLKTPNTVNPTSSLIPTIPTNIPATPTTPSLSIALEYASSGIRSNIEWQAVYPQGFVQEFDRIPMVLVPAGCFMKGTTDTQANYARSLGVSATALRLEQPNQARCIEKPFWIDQYETSQTRYLMFSQINPSVFVSASLPVENLSWESAHDYCEARSARLPMEVEWEYAARGPDSLIFPWGDVFDGERANYCDQNCNLSWEDKTANDGYQHTAPVGIYPLGISWVGAYGMSGNMWEWTNDLYAGKHILRGGSWMDSKIDLRSAARLISDADWNQTGGVRCVRDMDP